VTGDN
jgi:phospholipase A-2-activating protein